MGHSSVEHRLRADIEKRHRLRDEIKKRQSIITSLTRKLAHTKKKRLNNRYSVTIKRVSAEVEMLEHKLNEMNLDLQKRIMDEMEFSEGEAQDFREQYEKERTGILETESRLKAIEEEPAEPDAEETSEDESPSKEAIVARTKRMLKRERRAITGIQREMNSEERDQMLFIKELKQIAAELKEYREE